PRGEPPTLENDLDEPGAGLAERGVELAREDVEVLGPRAGHALGPGDADPVEVRTADLQHVARLAARLARADVLQLPLEDLVGPVGEHEHDYVEALARKRPERLDGVHAGAVAREAEHLAPRAG